MKQATGKTNSGPTANKVSIQLALDGHSFSVSGQPGAGEGPLTVEILTPRTLLVPEALFAPERAALLLAADGKAPLWDETTVCTLPEEGCVAVMAVPVAALDRLHELCGRGTPMPDVHYATPLLQPFNPARPTVQVQYRAGCLYVKVYHAGLQLAEVLPAPGEADLRYAFERLAEVFPAKQYGLQLLGAEAHPLARQIGHYYHETRCE